MQLFRNTPGLSFDDGNQNGETKQGRPVAIRYGGKTAATFLVRILRTTRFRGQSGTKMRYQRLGPGDGRMSANHGVRVASLRRRLEKDMILSARCLELRHRASGKEAFFISEGVAAEQASRGGNPTRASTVSITVWCAHLCLDGDLHRPVVATDRGDGPCSYHDLCVASAARGWMNRQSIEALVLLAAPHPLAGGEEKRRVL